MSPVEWHYAHGDQKAGPVWKQQLRNYQAPPLDPAVDEALNAFITQRKGEIIPEF